MLKKTFIALIATALMATAAHAGTCESYLGQTIAPKTFDQALLSMNAPSPKGEFETTAAYQARLQATGGTGPIVISKRMEDPKYIEYDADRGGFIVKSYLFDNTGFPAWEALYQGGLNPSTMSNADIVISQSEVVTGKYPAQNGFGAKAIITKYTKTVKAIYDHELVGYSQDLFVAKDEKLGFLPMEPAVAQAFRQTAKIAFVVVPKAPYVVRRTFRYGETTVRNPTDQTIASTVLIADIQCALLTDGANKVIGAYDTI